MRKTALLFFCVLVTACASHSQTPDALQLVIDVSKNANPDINARPSPVAFMLLQLKDDSTLHDVDYLALLRDPNTALGNTLLSKQTVAPVAAGKQTSVEINLHDNTRFVGVVAQVSQFRTRKTRVSIAVDSLRGKPKIRLAVDNNGVRVASADAKTPAHMTRFNED